jgi:hypothetical protein
MQKIHRLLGYLAIAGSLLGMSWASPTDFLLAKDGFGPIYMTIDINLNGDKAELKASARNDSGQPIRFARFCVAAKGRTRGCDFELWTTSVWKPGAVLTWPLLKGRPRSGLNSARVRITELEKF